MPNYIKRYRNAIPPNLCQQLIQRFLKDTRVELDPQPTYSKRTFLNISQLPDWKDLTVKLDDHANMTTRKYFMKPGFVLSDVPDKWENDGYVLARYAPGDTCALHYDGQIGISPNNGLRLATQLFYLNTLISGGSTHFPLQKLHIQPVQGTAIMFPVSFSYPHEVLRSNKERFVLQTWITDPDYIVLLRH